MANRIKGMLLAARIELKETYLQIINTMINTMSATRTATGSIARYTPTAVATPLPPLNPRYKGKRWPRNTARPLKAMTIEDPPLWITYATGRRPFIISPASVSRPIVFPAALATLVAPMLLLPTLLRSTPFILANITPTGIEPIRYENRI